MRLWKQPISLSIVCIYAISTLPIHVLAEASSVNNQKSIFDEGNYAQLIARFAELKEELHASDHRLLEAFRSLSTLIQEANAIYTMSFTLQDVVDAAKMHIEQLNLEPDAKNNLLKVIENLHSVEMSMKMENQILPAENILSIGIPGPHVYFPWFWNWFKSDKKKEIKPIHSPMLQIAHPELLPHDDPTIPDDLIIAGVEFLAAALLFIIPSGVSQAAAVFLASDGATRLWDGLKQKSELNRNHPIYPTPHQSYKD